MLWNDSGWVTVPSHSVCSEVTMSNSFSSHLFCGGSLQKWFMTSLLSRQFFCIGLFDRWSDKLVPLPFSTALRLLFSSGFSQYVVCFKIKLMFLILLFVCYHPILTLFSFKPEILSRKFMKLHTLALLFSSGGSVQGWSFPQKLRMSDLCQ